MANIMSQKNVRNKVHRNGFDLSFRNSFTAKVGELLPVFCKEVIPGDTFDIEVSSFTRTQPVNSAAFSRLREYYDFYFVPYSLLWDKFESFIVQTNQPFHAQDYHTGAKVDQQPYMSLKNLVTILNSVKANNVSSGLRPDYLNEVGFERYNCTLKLLQYLGYGDWISTMDDPGHQVIDIGDTDVMLNPFPLMAYQKIYQDYFRNSQWEKPAPWSYNVDYLMKNDPVSYFDLLVNPEQKLNAFYDKASGDSEAKYWFLDLRYANYKKDLFMGVLPSPQFGDTAIAAPITGSLTGVFTLGGTPDMSSLGYQDGSLMTQATMQANVYNKSSDGTQKVNLPYAQLNIDAANMMGEQLGKIPYQTAGVSVFALRQAEFLQKWREITQSGSLDYKEQIEKHWGVKVSPYQSYMCRWLGGSSGNITINEIVNQNLDTAYSTANLFGKASGSVGGKKIHFHSDGEYGIIMGIYHCEPVLDWAHVGLDRLNTKTDVGAYAIPEFDNLGMEALPVTDLCFSNGQSGLDGRLNPNSPYMQFLANLGKFTPIGYVPRYIEYKTSYDQINGSFLTSMSHWVSPLTYSDIYKKFFYDITSGESITGSEVSYETFKISPSVVDSIFAVNADNSIDTDCLLIGAFFDCKAVRNLSTDGLPY